MNEEEFWKIIAASKARGGGIPRRQGAALRELLQPLGADVIVDFSRHFEEAMESSYTQLILAAATVIYSKAGGPSDDNFDDVRAWIIAQGREVFEAAMENPDILADLINPDYLLDSTDGETVLYADTGAYEAIGGHGAQSRIIEHFFYARRFGKPEGDRWDADDLPRMLPKLWALVSLVRE